MSTERAVAAEEPCLTEEGLTTAMTGWERMHLSAYSIPTLLILTFLLVTTGMTAYEAVKHLLVTDLTLWESHTITILFCGFLATVVTYTAIRHNQARLNALQRLNRECKAMTADMRVQSNEKEKLTTSLRDLSLRLSKKEEETRKRYAAVLHEEVGQNLAVLNMIVEDSTDGGITGEAEVKKAASRMKPLLETTITSVRELTAVLYPTMLDDLGFIPAVKWYRDLLFTATGAKVAIDVDSAVETLSPDTLLSLFRLIQEALMNIVKHARATEVALEVEIHPDSLTMSIKDNGVGFDVDEVRRRRERGVGLMLLQERSLALGGDLALRSAPGEGSEVAFQMPLKRR